MQKEDCYYLGTITKAHGYKGELNVHLDTDQPEYYKNLESVFIERNGLLVPFFLTKAQIHKKRHLRIILEDFDDPNALIGRDVFLPLTSLPPLDGKKFYFHEVVGFTIVSQNDEIVGQITFVRDTTSQDLFEVETASKKIILVPIIDDWIIEVDRKHQKIAMQLPEGLIELYES